MYQIVASRIGEICVVRYGSAGQIDRYFDLDKLCSKLDWLK